jgi:hypothetical protein
MSRIDDLLQELPTLVAELSDMRAAQKAESKLAREAIKEKQSEIDDLVDEIERAVYTDRPDYDRNVMERVRSDTGEIVSSRPLTNLEKQTYLAEIDPNVPKPPKRAPSDIEADLDREYGEE